MWAYWGREWVYLDDVYVRCGCIWMVYERVCGCIGGEMCLNVSVSGW